MKIEKGFSFASQLDNITIVNHHKALQYYTDNFNNAIDLKNDIPIFLDTNVLIHIYKISLKAREKLTVFFNDNRHRLFITNQVQTEFIKNREERIDEFNNEIKNVLPDSFQKQVINQIQDFLNKNQTILIDYSFLKNKLENIKNECSNLLKELNEEIKQNCSTLADSKYADEKLKLFSEFQILSNLETEELNFIKSEFDNFKKCFADKDINKEIEKSYQAFPGAGDIKEKPSNPYGDYIIFHEILKFVNENKKDVVFLTFDRTKGDWLKKNREQHLHYIENVFLNTGRSIYILDAENLFEKLLDISFKSVINETEIKLDADSDFIRNFSLYWIQLENLMREYASSLNLIKPKSPSLYVTKALENIGFFNSEEMLKINFIRNLKTYTTHGDFEILNSLNERSKYDIIEDTKFFIRKIIQEKNNLNNNNFTDLELNDIL